MINKLILLLIIFCLYQFLPIYDPELSKDYLYYAKTSFCQKQEITDWTCPSCAMNPGVQKGNVYVVNNIVDGTYGFVAYNTDTNLIVVSFRGSDNIQNWLEDINYFKIEYEACDGCEVHKGFKQAWDSLSKQVLKHYGDLIKQYPTAETLVTGHSLGAAIAELAAYNLIQNGYKVEHFYNYGSPRTGNVELAQYAHSILPNAMRVVHYKDPVPHLPLQSMGFRALPTEVWYDSQTDINQYKVCYMPGVEEDPNCSDKEINLNFSDHTYYLGMNTGCGVSQNDNEEEQDQLIYQKSLNYQKLINDQITKQIIKID